MDLSVIYPVHITFQTRYILKRLQCCLQNTNSGLPNAEHLIALSGSHHYVKKARKLVNELNFPIRVLDYSQPTTPYSPGIARNFAVKHATSEHLLFWDIDLLGSPNLYSDIPLHIEEIRKQANVFHMYPCLYLCSEYSKNFSDDFDQLWQDATNLKTNSIEHFAMATSTILCNKKHFLDIGAFDEDFIGHMGEDLELLNRLSIAYGKYPFEPDHCEDHPSKIPSELKGFRKHFLLHSIANLTRAAFTAHIHHKIRINSNYQSNKKRNRALLISKIKDRNKSLIFSAISISYPNYLDSRPLIFNNLKTRVFKKINKFISNPYGFFKDISYFNQSNRQHH